MYGQSIAIFSSGISPSSPVSYLILECTYSSDGEGVVGTVPDYQSGLARDEESAILSGHRSDADVRQFPEPGKIAFNRDLTSHRDLRCSQ